MDDAALQNRLGRIELLLVLTVSLLSGLVLGSDPGAQRVYAVISLVILGILTTFIAGLQGSFAD